MSRGEKCEVCGVARPPRPENSDRPPRPPGPWTCLSHRGQQSRVMNESAATPDARVTPDVLDRLMELWERPWSEERYGEAQVLLSRIRAAASDAPAPPEFRDLLTDAEWREAFGLPDAPAPQPPAETRPTTASEALRVVRERMTAAAAGRTFGYHEAMQCVEVVEASIDRGDNDRWEDDGGA